MTHAEYSAKLLAEAPAASMPAWSIVLYFYAALHAVNHALYGGVNVAWSTDHVKRETDMRGHKTLRGLLPKYRNLKRWSEDARYKPWLYDTLPACVPIARALALEIVAVCGLPDSNPS